MTEKTNKGLALALVAALISGVSVFVNGVGVTLADPSAYTALKGIGALMFIAASALAVRGIRHFKGLSGRQWAMLALIGILGGSVPFLMFFWGLKLGGAAVSSFIYRSLFVFAGVTGYLMLRERPEPRDLAAGFVMLAGNALLLSGQLTFGPGQALVLCATVLWAVEYTLSRKVMADVHPSVVMVCRLLFGSLIILAFLTATGGLASLSVPSAVLPWLVLTSLLLAGFMASWYGALRHLPVLRAASVFALGGIVTAVLNLAFLGKAISFNEALGLTLLLAGVLMMVGLSRAISSSRELVASLIG